MPAQDTEGSEAHIDYFHMGPWPFYCGFTTSPEQFQLEMERLSINDAPRFVTSDHSHATTHLFTKDDGLTAIIAMPKPRGRSREQVAGLIAHEAVHVVQELWTQLGELEPGKEAEAYLVQHIVQCCLQVAFKTNRVRKSEP